MERYIIRGPRDGSAYPVPNDNIVAYAEMNPGNMAPEAVYYNESYGNEFPGMQRSGNMNGGFMRVVHANTPSFPQSGMNSVALRSPQQGTSIGQCIYSEVGNSTIVEPPYMYRGTAATGDHLKMPMMPTAINPPWQGNFENRSFSGPERSRPFQARPGSNMRHSLNDITQSTVNTQVIQKIDNKQASSSKTVIMADESLKPHEETAEMPTRADKIKALHKSGCRAFSGPVEKVLKWHKALQDIGILVIYEIVAKCVSVSSGESCAKHLVIRDDNGPAMQVVYYEIDFLLPEIKPPSTVRVVGKMMAGTSRFQAFNVRPATGDDVSIQPRRAAVAQHHVAKLCKEYGVNAQI